jgi:acetyl-CoA carboxylase carboxyltransferase component
VPNLRSDPKFPRPRLVTLLANQNDTPLVFLQNTTGYMVGAAYEQGGIIKDGAKMINAVTNSTVPHVTINMGASFGAGN